VPTGTVLLSTTTGVLRDRLTDRFGDRQHVLQIGRAILALRSADGDEHDGRGTDGAWEIGGETETILGLIAEDHFLEARLVDRESSRP